MYEVGVRKREADGRDVQLLRRGCCVVFSSASGVPGGTSAWSVHIRYDKWSIHDAIQIHITPSVLSRLRAYLNGMPYLNSITRKI
jgi:hypothetical protein